MGLKKMIQWFLAISITAVGVDVVLSFAREHIHLFRRHLTISSVCIALKALLKTKILNSGYVWIVYAN